MSAPGTSAYCNPGFICRPPTNVPACEFKSVMYTWPAMRNKTQCLLSTPWTLVNKKPASPFFFPVPTTTSTPGSKSIAGPGQPTGTKITRDVLAKEPSVISTTSGDSGDLFVFKVLRFSLGFNPNSGTTSAAKVDASSPTSIVPETFSNSTSSSSSTSSRLGSLSFASWPSRTLNTSPAPAIASRALCIDANEALRVFSASATPLATPAKAF
mmetsp:Transcript_8026/g.26649  ORF Transcript_8026/g.26649 Transcript_8026/m.26649 type:complete len:212 (-) Transcript_8026:589-1224(-)